MNRFLSVSCIILLLHTGCIQKYNTYGVVGMPTVTNDGKYTACIVAACDAITRQENGGFRKTTYNTSYWLNLYETATGKLLKKKKLGNNPNNTGIECFGIYKSNIWLYAGGIRAFAITDLSEQYNEEKIAQQNGLKKTIFPYGIRLVSPSMEEGHIDFIADNGEAYQLLLENQIIQRKNEITDNHTDIEKRIHHLMNRDEFGVRCDTMNERMFILAKDSIAAGMITPHNQSVNDVAYRMKMYKAAFTTKKLGMHSIVHSADIQATGANSYLNASFAMDNNTLTPIRLANPAGYLIIHQDVLGENSKAIFTRVDTTGKNIWETKSAISTKIAACILNNKYVLFTSNKNYMLSPHVGKDAMCMVELETGNIIPFTLDN